MHLRKQRVQLGVAPGSPQCGPDSGTSRADSAPSRPTGEWIKTWGAIATSSSTGEVGTTVGKLTEAEARSMAIHQCFLGGADDCKVNLDYHNQCAALTASQTTGSFFQGAATEELATDLAMKNCENSGGGSCRVVYSECTKPIFRRF